MSAPARLAAFGLALVAALVAGAGLGAVAGPEPSTTEAEAPAPVGDGVVATAEGYRLVPGSSVLDASGGTFELVIEGPDGTPVLAFDPVHERDLHLIVVNRELTDYHHLHPVRDDAGTWSVDLPRLAPGSYRAVADFVVRDGPRLALGTDLSVGGPYEVTALADPASTSQVDGYQVTITTEDGGSGTVQVALVVRRGGQVVTDLEPYLGADGHLVAMRSGDLAYAHVHPTEDTTPTPGQVTFSAALAGAGRYALFFDFKHEGVVHTAPFTYEQGVVDGAPPMEH